MQTNKNLNKNTLNNNMKNITLALSLNYSKKFLTPFLESYDKHCTDPLYLITELPLELFNYKNIKPVSIVSILNKHNISSNITAFNLKPILFYLFLKQFTDVSRVLVTDVDVVFQNNPFEKYKNETDTNFIVCEEKRFYRECDTNTMWLKISYPQFADDLKDVKILNSGVVYGNKDIMQDYFKKMAYEMQNILSKCNYPILDQIILNIFYYKTKNIKPKVLKHCNDFILHLSQVCDDTELSNNNILNNKFIFDGVKPCIVHQYNKKPLLNNFFTNMYKQNS